MKTLPGANPCWPSTGSLPQGLALWLDFSATPKDQSGMYYPWTVCDYPLAQAVEDRITKAPLIVTQEDDPKQPTEDPDNLTKDNVCEKYGYWIQAAVHRWKEHWKTYCKLGTKPVLFIMAEKNVYADAIGQYLWKTKEFGFKESEILVIHTDAAGEVTKTDLDKAREAARDIDKPEQQGQGHRQRDDASRGLGRAERVGRARPAAVHGEGRNPAGAGHRPRAAPDDRHRAGPHADAGGARHAQSAQGAARAVGSKKASASRAAAPARRRLSLSSRSWHARSTTSPSPSPSPA